MLRRRAGSTEEDGITSRGATTTGSEAAEATVVTLGTEETGEKTVAESGAESMISTGTETGGAKDGTTAGGTPAPDTGAAEGIHGTGNGEREGESMEVTSRGGA